MKWVAVVGSWRNVNNRVINDVKKMVASAVKSGNGIVTGGALGVDSVATETVMEQGNVAEQLKVYLPVRLHNFIAHYERKAKQGAITDAQADAIIGQLEKVKKLAPKAIIDDSPYKAANEESYYARNTKIVENCDVLYAFHVNNSAGTQDAIDKARQSGKKVFEKKYFIYQ